eukprot:gnl/TRDRNA2_/TRDRNA2_195095_c0_seq1.p1 gnl/TRDRNA2_/TRDRNA2_195095_c0~~gnl/TRDRNA2_/TRDRNA2_195095_c0_seq1.p1  ORF type:complete len:254 (+),score=52.49 gnl/TRDRNA2_/TRDRNA2_195095_c0_seq1:73-762(+)
MAQEAATAGADGRASEGLPMLEVTLLGGKQLQLQALADETVGSIRSRVAATLWLEAEGRVRLICRNAVLTDFKARVRPMLLNGTVGTRLNAVVLAACSTCGGSGRGLHTCGNCNGVGRVMRGIDHNFDVVNCDVCGEVGLVEGRCEACGGEGAEPGSTRLPTPGDARSVCGSCGGSGAGLTPCDTCNGLWRFLGGLGADHNFDDVDCDVCGNSGLMETVCEDCAGEGVV